MRNETDLAVVRAERARTIRAWIDATRTPPSAVQRCPSVSRLLDEVGPVGTGPAAEGVRTVVDLAARFESLLGAGDRRRERGVVYTPEYIVDALVGHALATAAARSTDLSVLDPACGAGAFLVGAVGELVEVAGLRPSDAAELVTGADIDPEAAAAARELVELRVLELGDTPRRAPHVVVADSLASDPAALLAQLERPGGFGVVVTNPPYVKLQHLETTYREVLRRQFGDLASGNFSLSMLFLVRCIELLHERGVSGLITQNNFFTSLAGQKIRRHLTDTSSVRRIVDFRHAKVFAGASAYTCLLYADRSGGAHLEYAEVVDPSREAIRDAAFSDIDLAALDPKKWRLAPEPHLSHLRAIESVGEPLGRVATIRVGFATLKDRVFMVRDRGDDVVGVGPSGDPMPVERAITRPAIRVADIGDGWDLAANARRVIFPYVHGPDGYRGLSEDELADQFPLADAYLWAWRAELEARDSGKGAAEAWFLWSRRQSMDAPGPKLLTKTFDRRPRFTLDPTDSLFANGYSVAPKEALPASHAGLDVAALDVLLNSSLMHYFALLTSFQIDGDFQCYQKNFIERFGIPSTHELLLAGVLDHPAGEARERSIAELYGVAWSDVKQYIESRGLRAVPVDVVRDEALAEADGIELVQRGDRPG
jgi:protein-L-isoaspartate O-methyltransferase